MGTRGSYGGYLGSHRHGHLSSHPGGVYCTCVAGRHVTHLYHQSCKEELDGGRVNDIGTARDAVEKLWSGVEESSRDVEIWGGEFPFDRAANSIECWRV